MNPDQFNPHNPGVLSASSRSSRLVLYFKPVFILVFVCFLGTVMAQRRSHAALTYGGGDVGSNFDSGYGIVFGVGYDAPLGNLKNVYKPAINYSIGVSRFMSDFTVSLTLGYHAYKPKDDLVTSGDIENTSTLFSDYRVYSAYAGIVYNLNLADNVRLYGGGNIGLYSTHYAFSSTDNVSEFIVDLRERDVYLAPRLGLIFALTNNIGLSLESKYNFFAPTGKSDYASSGTFYTSVAAQAAITFKF